MAERHLLSLAQRQIAYDIRHVKIGNITEKTLLQHDQRLLGSNLCAKCKHLRVRPQSNHHNSIGIKCKAGNEPRELYRSTPWGQEPQCPDFSPE